MIKFHTIVCRNTKMTKNIYEPLHKQIRLAKGEKERWDKINDEIEKERKAQRNYE